MDLLKSQDFEIFMSLAKKNKNVLACILFGSYAKGTQKKNSDLDNSQYRLFKNFIDYRNYIAHEYDEIAEEEIFWCLNHLDFIKEFMKIVKVKLIDN